mgnify:CR=1 FL=1
MAEKPPMKQWMTQKTCSALIIGVICVVLGFLHYLWSEVSRLEERINVICTSGGVDTGLVGMLKEMCTHKKSHAKPKTTEAVDEQECEVESGDDEGEGEEVCQDQE